MTLETTEMNKPLLAITALVSGAAAMYFLDPEQGRRRRAQVRDQVVAAGGDAYGFVGANAKRAADQTLGALASARRFVWPFGAATREPSTSTWRRVACACAARCCAMSSRR